MEAATDERVGCAFISADEGVTFEQLKAVSMS